MQAAMIDLEAIRERDSASAATWFKSPNTGPARAFQDRRAPLSHVDRLRHTLLRECCRCGPTDPDPAVHAGWCVYRQWFEGNDAAQHRK